MRRRCDADCRRLLRDAERRSAIADAAQPGDRLVLLEARYENVPQAEVARLFGSEFAEAIVKQPPGAWVGSDARPGTACTS